MIGVEKLFWQPEDPNKDAEQRLLSLRAEKSCIMGPPQILDLLQLQEGFHSLIAQAQPDHVAAFFYWLDLKVAQYKVFGNCITQDMNFSPIKTRHFVTNATPYNTVSTPERPSYVTDLSTTPREQNGLCNGVNGKHPQEKSLPTYAVPPALSFEEPVVPASTMQELYETAADGLTGNHMVKSLLRAMLAKPKINDHIVDSDIKHEQDSTGEDVPEVVSSLEAKDDDSQSANDSFLRDDPMSVESESEATAGQGNSSAAEGGSEQVGEKASRCPYCLKVFRYRSSYRRHVKIHEGVFSHECTICLRKFTRKEHFIRHKCDRRPNKPYHITHEVFRRLSASEKAAIRQAPELFGPQLTILKSRTDASAVANGDAPLELTSHSSSMKTEIPEGSVPANVPLPVVLCSIPSSVQLNELTAAALMSMTAAAGQHQRSVSFATELSNLEGYSLHHNESRRKSSTPRKVVVPLQSENKNDTSFDAESSESAGNFVTRDLNCRSSVSVAN